MDRPPSCRIRMTEEMARATLWASEAMIRALIASWPERDTPGYRDHIRRLRALEHVRDNLVAAISVEGWSRKESDGSIPLG